MALWLVDVISPINVRPTCCAVALNLLILTMSLSLMLGILPGTPPLLFLLVCPSVRKHLNQLTGAVVAASVIAAFSSF